MPDSHKSDTQPKNFSTAVVLVGEEQTPHYELTAEKAAYQINGVTNNVHWSAYFYLKAIAEPDFIRTFEDIGEAIEFRQERRDVLSLEAASRDVVSDVVVKHFDGIEGLAKDAPKEAQAKWLEANYAVQYRIWTEGINNVALDEGRSIEGALDILSGKTSNDVAIVQNLYCPEVKRVVPVSIVYHLRDEKKEDRRQFEAATRSVVDLRRDVRKVRENYNTISSLFNSMFFGADGLLYQGKPLDPKNDVAFRKAVNAIPFPHKYLVVRTAFDEQRAKNV